MTSSIVQYVSKNTWKQLVFQILHAYIVIGRYTCHQNAPSWLDSHVQF